MVSEYATKPPRPRRPFTQESPSCPTPLPTSCLTWLTRIALISSELLRCLRQRASLSATDRTRLEAAEGR